MPKTLTYDRVDPDTDGSLALRCTYSEDGRQKTHYMQFQVGADIAAVVVAADQSLTAAGFSAIPQDAIDAITATAAQAWTPQVVAAANAARSALEASLVPTIEQDNARIRAELAALDILSIRGLREYVAAQANAPQIIKDREAAAQAKRGQLK